MTARAQPPERLPLPQSLRSRLKPLAWSWPSLDADSLPAAGKTLRTMLRLRMVPRGSTEPVTFWRMSQADRELGDRLEPAGFLYKTRLQRLRMRLEEEHARGRDLDRIGEVLASAKQARLQEEGFSSGTSEFVASLRDAGTRFEDICRELEAFSVWGRQSGAMGHFSANLPQAIGVFLRSARAELKEFSHVYGSMLNRGRGRSRSTWRRRAERDLAALGIGKDAARSLFEAIGLSRPRRSDP